MHYLIIAKDGSDEKAPERRLASREKHLASIAKLISEGKALYGAALIDDHGAMKGSILIMDFPSQDDLEHYLATEPYITGKVWQQVEVKPCRVPELFLNK
ncbi:MAG TPA: YciI family protein [Desulfomonilia bacterium]|nr:YciI family protein [Desulfomonilia bacterium]